MSRSRFATVLRVNLLLAALGALPTRMFVPFSALGAILAAWGLQVRYAAMPSSHSLPEPEETRRSALPTGQRR